MFNLQLAWDRPAKINSQSEHILRVRIVPSGVSTQTLPLQLAVALDTSASMQGEKWERAKAACQELVAQLRPGDRLSLSGFADWVTPVVQNLQHNQGELQAVLDTLVAEGVTRTDLALNWIKSALPPSSKARVGIIITDGHPTTDSGEILEDISPLVEQAETMAAEGITLCTVGLGDAGDFNSPLLIGLSDRSAGAFIYADNPTLLATQLQDRLQALQTIAVEDVTIKLDLAAFVKLKSCCQFRPDYLPLAETATGEIFLRNLRADISTDVLLALEVSAQKPGQLSGSYTIAQIQLQTSEFSLTASAALQFTSSYREAQQINLEVDRDRLVWDINRFSTELAYVNDPLQTGELLSHIQAAALKSGQIAIAAEVTQQLDDLYKTGKLTAHQATGLLRATRQYNS
ncbi:VWA domain-containing protein [Hassallia byssoidea VB512170]|uniref:VWA domain-containing protein n=1 Tax=Hassallia byssoidea VB512170 TaxID=1304833 RepID=A0A846HCI1_9CYAN|nr:VWA domain-containing protein [Hassalia byssoidea]NEU74310.1 VWA domain-containing protein [Hassalia byssoidea VB512170]